MHVQLSVWDGYKEDFDDHLGFRVFDWIERAKKLVIVNQKDTVISSLHCLRLDKWIVEIVYIVIRFIFI